MRAAATLAVPMLLLVLLACEPVQASEPVVCVFYADDTCVSALVELSSASSCVQHYFTLLTPEQEVKQAGSVTVQPSQDGATVLFKHGTDCGDELWRLPVPSACTEAKDLEMKVDCSTTGSYRCFS